MSRKTFLFILFSIACVWNQSRVHLLGILSVIAVVLIYRTVEKNKTVPLRKYLLYLGVLPFALWWTFSPDTESGISPWLFYIPAWYFIFLSLMQWRSLGRGGFLVFVQWNALAACVVSLNTFDKLSLFFALSAFFVFLWSVRSPGSLVRFWGNILLFIVFTTGLVGGTLALRDAFRSGKQQKNWGEDYYLKKNMMGFNAVSQLGSFETNFRSEYKEQVVLRLWTKKAPDYVRAIAYERYVPTLGLWKKPDVFKTLYPGPYHLNYATFGSEDINSEPIWVQSTLNLEFLFLPMDASTIGIQADSVFVYAGTSYQNSQRKDWFYWTNSSQNLNDSLDTLSWLLIPEKLEPLLSEVSLKMGLDTLEGAQVLSERIREYFQNHFEYSLQVPFKGRRNKKEPLEVFWNSQKGYCEYYASLATLLLRRYGVSARYVNGFARPDHLEGYSVFRRKHAHTWVEYKETSGWITFDPTPAADEDLQIKPYWERKREYWSAKITFLFHQLKEGAWRQKVDEWQVYTQKMVENPLFFSALLGIFVGFFGIRFWIKRKKQNKNHLNASERTRLWQEKLHIAERGFERFGLKRGFGETVGHFLSRIPSKNEFPERKQKHYQRYRLILEEYEAKRWKKK